VSAGFSDSFFAMNNTLHSFQRFLPVIGQLGLAIGAGFLMFALL
jgi:hypothetical protein